MVLVYHDGDRGDGEEEHQPGEVRETTYDIPGGKRREVEKFNEK